MTAPPNPAQLRAMARPAQPCMPGRHCERKARDLGACVAGYCNPPPADGQPEALVPLPAETAQPMFASHVGRRKWDSLQGDGYRMQRIQFARSLAGHERRGSIDPWGKVLWEPDGVGGRYGA
jgi:hypothetical protein